MPQVWGKVKIPAGKNIAVNLGCDFDAQSLWICLKRTSPAYMSRGEFGPEVGLPRLMRLFAFEPNLSFSAVNPSMSFIITSMMISCGRSLETTCIASCPLLAATIS